jgi:hypothetical protein
VSNIEVDIINSITGGTIVVGPKLSVFDSTNTFENFSSATSGIVVTSLIYAGTEQDNSSGVSGQVLFGNGPTAPVTWSFPPVPKSFAIPSGTIIPWVVQHNGFCPSGTLPSVPKVGQDADWIYCDGKNGTPDYRILDPKSTTGGKNFPPFSSSDVVVTLDIINVTGSTDAIRDLYRINPLERLIFYRTNPAASPIGTDLGPTTASTIGVLLTVTGPTTVGASGKPTGVPTHQYARIRIGGMTGSTASLWATNAQGTPASGAEVNTIIGEFYTGAPTDFTANGYINFKTGTGDRGYRVQTVVSTDYIQSATIQDWSNRCRYKYSIAYIKKL